MAAPRALLPPRRRPARRRRPRRIVFLRGRRAIGSARCCRILGGDLGQGSFGVARSASPPRIRTRWPRQRARGSFSFRPAPDLEWSGRETRCANKGLLLTGARGRAPSARGPGAAPLKNGTLGSMGALDRAERQPAFSRCRVRSSAWVCGLVGRERRVELVTDGVFRTGYVHSFPRLTRVGARDCISAIGFGTSSV